MPRSFPRSPQSPTPSLSWRMQIASGNMCCDRSKRISLHEQRLRVLFADGRCVQTECEDEEGSHEENGHRDRENRKREVPPRESKTSGAEEEGGRQEAAQLERIETRNGLHDVLKRPEGVADKSHLRAADAFRSEERRVGKECRSRW